MQLPSRQRGLGMWGWLYVLGTLGFIGMVTFELIPMYLNEMAIAKVVKTVANEPSAGSLSPPDLRRNMQLRWDLERITALKTSDVKIVKSGSGRALSYDYETRANLFKNLYLVVQFQNTFPLSGGGGIE